MKLNFDDTYIPKHVYIEMLEDNYFDSKVERHTNLMRARLSKLIHNQNILYNSESNHVVTIWDNETKERFVAGYNARLTSVYQEMQKVYQVHDDMLIRILGKAYRDKLIYSHKEERVPVRVKVISIYNILNENVYMMYPKDIMIILIDYILRGLIRNEIK